MFSKRNPDPKKETFETLFSTIQIASDFEKLILQPEQVENLIKVAKRLPKEPWEPSKKQVESSAKEKLLTRFP